MGKTAVDVGGARRSGHGHGVARYVALLVETGNNVAVHRSAGEFDAVSTYLGIQNAVAVDIAGDAAPGDDDGVAAGGFSREKAAAYVPDRSGAERRIGGSSGKFKRACGNEGGGEPRRLPAIRRHCTGCRYAERRDSG